jgi:hypothetical protein
VDVGKIESKSKIHVKIRKEIPPSSAEIIVKWFAVPFPTPTEGHKSKRGKNMLEY